MKLEDFAYAVAEEVLKSLETDHHYKVPDHIRKEIVEKVMRDIDNIVAGQSKK